jgi:hypothetical protein
MPFRKWEWAGLERIRVLASSFLTLAVILSAIDTLLVIFRGWAGYSVGLGECPFRYD